MYLYPFSLFSLRGATPLKQQEPTNSECNSNRQRTEKEKSSRFRLRIAYRVPCKSTEE